MNYDTNEIEYSRVIYDDFGRQTHRVDYTNHGRLDHASVHLHERQWGPGYDPKHGRELPRYDLWNWFPAE